MSTYVKVEFGDGRHSLELLPGVTEREGGEHQVDHVLPVSTAAQLKQRKVLALEQLLYREREGKCTDTLTRTQKTAGSGIQTSVYSKGIVFPIQ